MVADANDQLVSPERVSEYERWARLRAASFDDYLFAEEVSRFDPVGDDVLVAADDISVGRVGRALTLSSAKAAARVNVEGVSEAAAARVLSAIDGDRTVAEVEQVAGVERRELERMLKAAFGVLVFAPLGVASLERQLSGIEITRFPGSPYEIVRTYWQNMISVRNRAPSLEPSLDDVERAWRRMRELHVLALMGEDHDSYYQPSSRIGAKGIGPGVLLETPSHTADTPEGTIFLSGPRVNVSLIGGELYHRTLYGLLGDPQAVESDRELSEDGGPGWGRIVTARAEGDERAAPWFCPPRPLQRVHLASVVGSLAAALAKARQGDRDATVRHLANLHQRFIRLHPFRCANQCLVMNLVNYVLSISHGAGMPHQVLDHFALRVSERAYERVFRAAAEGFLLTEGGPLHRYQELRSRKRRAFDFIKKLAGCRSRDEALQLARSSPEDARLALLPV